MAGITRQALHDPSPATSGRAARLTRPQLDPFAFDAGLDNSIHSLNERLDEYYNAWIPALKNRPTADQPRIAAVRIQQRLHSMQRTLNQTMRWFEAQKAVVAAEMDAFVAANGGAIRLWEAGNIFTQRVEKIQHILPACLPLTAQELDDYLRKTLVRHELPRLLSSQYQDDADAFHKDHFSKIAALARHLARMPHEGRHRAARLWIFYITEVLRHTHAQRFPYELVRQQIKDLIEDQSDVGIQQDVDFLSLAQALHSRGGGCHLSVRDPDSLTSPGRAPEAMQCYHAHTIPLLALLHRAATGERREQIYRAVGVLLPAELADEVTTLAVVAERWPMDDSPVDAQLWRAWGRYGECLIER